MQFETGDTFKIDFDSLEVNRKFPVSNGHTWILVSDVTQDPVVLLNCSSVKPGNSKTDPTCILTPDDHSTLSEKSFIYYRRPIPFELSELRGAWNSGNLIKKSRLDDAILKKVQRGALKSDRTPIHFQKYLKGQDLI